MLGDLRQEVLAANMDLVRQGLVYGTFGNASGLARAMGLVVIKPSGVPYEELRPEMMVVTDLEGKIVEGDLRPSSDLATHLALYRAFDAIGGVVHTHARYATAWAQAGREIPCLGTTHADYYCGPVPITDPMTPREISSEYELNTGRVIVRRFRGLNPAMYPSVLVHGHGPFSWGASAAAAAHHAALLEEIARLALYTVEINPAAAPISKSLLDKHFFRKHGPEAYYGQKAPS